MNDKNRSVALDTIAETTEYRETVGWVPYNEYLEKIYYHCPGRDFDEHNMKSDWCDKLLEPDRLIREAAYLLSLKLRPCHSHDDKWTEEEQLDLEEIL